MLKSKFFWNILLLVQLISAPVLSADKSEFRLSKDIRQEAKRFDFKIAIKSKLPEGISGKIVPAAQAEAELLRFFNALDDLGIKFVRKSGLKNVMIVENLSRHGKNIAGHTYNNSIYLKYGFSKRTVYHEIFHVFDNKQNDPEWLRLNHKDFRYHGISYPDRPLKNSLPQQNFAADFASRYAQTREREDRAETFTCMIDEGHAFAQRAAKSPVLYAKMMYIVKMTGKRSLLDQSYWERKLGRQVFLKRKSSKR